MRLIDADALEEQGWIMHRTVAINPQTMEWQTKKPTEFPTIDAVPVVHGYWKETQQPCGWTDIACATCSVCGEDYPLGDYGIDDFNELSHYCCNCGAKMDGERKDDDN